MPIGYCVDVQAMGFGDNIRMMIGVSADHRVIGIRILSIAETPGIGMAVADEDYLSGYVGLAAPVTFGDGPNEADAITGATYSSRAILNGVNLALEYLRELDDVSDTTDTSAPSADPTETEDTDYE